MRNVRNLALASGAVIALALGGTALAHGDAEHGKNHAEHMERMASMHGEMPKPHGKRERHGKHEHPQPEQAPAK